MKIYEDGLLVLNPMIANHLYIALYIMNAQPPRYCRLRIVDIDPTKAFHSHLYCLLQRAQGAYA